MLGLALDEPAETDERVEVEGLPFIMETRLAQGLDRYFPLRVDYDDAFWKQLRVIPGKGVSCC